MTRLVLSALLITAGTTVLCYGETSSTVLRSLTPAEAQALSGGELFAECANAGCVTESTEQLTNCVYSTSGFPACPPLVCISLCSGSGPVELLWKCEFDPLDTCNLDNSMSWGCGTSTLGTCFRAPRPSGYCQPTTCPATGGAGPNCVSLPMGCQ